MFVCKKSQTLLPLWNVDILTVIFKRRLMKMKSWNMTSYSQDVIKYEIWRHSGPKHHITHKVWKPQVKQQKINWFLLKQFIFPTRFTAKQQQCKNNIMLIFHYCTVDIPRKDVFRLTFYQDSIEYEVVVRHEITSFNHLKPQVKTKGCFNHPTLLVNYQSV